MLLRLAQATFVVFAASSSCALAQAVPASFVGIAMNESVSGRDCDTGNIQTGEAATAVFRPVQDGVATASLQLLSQQWAFRVQPSTGGSFANSGAYTATIFTGRGGQTSYSGNYKFKFKPVPTATSTGFNLTGTISNFKNQGTCTVTFDAAFVPKP